jgi:transposase
MLQITPHQKFFLAVDPIDFRKGIDGIAAICRHKLQTDPMSGVLFIFTNRKRTAVKILVYDGQGFWLCQKRFSSGRLAWWPTHSSVTHPITACQLQILLYQGDPSCSTIPPDWKRI